MKTLIALLAAATLLSGCVVAPYPYYGDPYYPGYYYGGPYVVPYGGVYYHHHHR